MIRILFLLFVIKGILFGCTICTIYSPLTKVSIKVNATNERINTAEITWVLTKEFTDQLKIIYDKNQNQRLDKKELEPIEQSILDYVVDKNFLMHISYDEVIDLDESKEIVVNNYKTYVENSILHFKYELSLDYKVVFENVLYININDDEQYFILKLAKDAVAFNAPFTVSTITKEQSVVFYSSKELVNNKEIEKKLEDKEPKIAIEDEVKVEKETLLGEFSKKVKEYLLKVEQGNSYALFVLLGISFIYGVLHALGPGHGKSLAFSYFVSNKSSFIKAFWISQASAFIHIVGALVLVMVSVFLLQSILNNFINDSVEILTKVSSVMIILLAIYILYNKLKNKSCSCSSCCSSTNTNPTWSVSKPKQSTNLKANFMKKDLYFVLTAGLIPCPGTVVLFIYAFILKTYFAVILASIFVSFGMGLVIFISSFFGVYVHNLSERSHKITNFLEIIAPIVMFILGILLFLNAEIL